LNAIKFEVWVSFARNQARPTETESRLWDPTQDLSEEKLRLLCKAKRNVLAENRAGNALPYQLVRRKAELKQHMKKLGFIGGGNMAEALIRGLLAQSVFAPPDLIASDVDRGRRQRLKRIFKIEVTGSNSDVVHNARALLIAVKPQNIDEVIADLKADTALSPGNDARPIAIKAKLNGRAKRVPAAKSVSGDKLIISIAAGIPIERFTAGLGPDARVIRVMPNAPAMVGEGMAALVPSPGANRADEAFALKIFNAVGDAVALRTEGMLDAVTALSGSGPAYVYLFVKAMTDAAIGEGLPPELALRMALKTLRGAEANMRQSKLDAAELIRIVASPGGTTEAALRKFAEAGFSDIVATALRAAAARSRELGRVKAEAEPRH
jgi:pyrroline-5-carboxylate reductase